MDRPKDLPNRLECAYCKRNYSHGGECNGKGINKNEEGCLFFQCDERGCIRRADIKFPIEIYDNIPPVGTWEHDRWGLYGEDTSIKIHSIKGLNWDKKRGLLFIYADCSYYVNEFSESYIEEESKPKLRVIK